MSSSILESAIKDSKSIQEVLGKLGFIPHVNYYSELRERCQALGLTLPTYVRVFQMQSKPLKDILIEGSTYNRQTLKARLIEHGLKQNICEICGIGNIWNNLPLVLQLDHINGIFNDNRLGNLRIICPNCHTQTDTYCGKGKTNSNRLDKPKSPKKTYYYKDKCECGEDKSKTATFCRICSGMKRFIVDWPPLDELIFLLENNNYVQVGKMLGCTDNAIRKHIRKEQSKKS